MEHTHGCLLGGSENETRVSKQPYIPFYTGDWLKDPAISVCTPATRGVWIDLLCAMHEHGRSGELCGTATQLARLARCETSELIQALTELQTTSAAEVQNRNGSWTIANRRMQREASTREKRSLAGSQGGSKAQANREQIPEYESEDEGLKKVREFARGEGIQTRDADWFFWKCHANGWQNGGQPIRDWKATMRSWQRAGYLPSQKTGRIPSQAHAPLKVVKPQPDAWPQWLKAHYPDAKEKDFWRVTDDVKREFRTATTQTSAAA